MPPTLFPGLGSLDDLTTGIVPLVASIMFVWFVNIGVVGWLARRKGREDGVWAVLAIFFGPFALIAILLKAKQAPPPETEVERLAIAQAGHLHLRDDTQLELEVAGRPAWLPGELLERIKGRPVFRLAASTAWRWSDGNPLDDQNRRELVRQLPKIGKRDGWILRLSGDDLA
jgi:hypothetical protein